MQTGERRASCISRRRDAVSEVVGSLFLVAGVIFGIALVWVLLFSNPMPVKVPILDTIISNRSRDHLHPPPGR